MKKPCTGCKYSRKETWEKSSSPNNPIMCAGCQKYCDYLKFKESKRKYKAGEVIKSIQEFDEHIRDGFMYLHGTIKHVGWLTSMQYGLIKSYIARGSFRIAIKK